MDGSVETDQVEAHLMRIATLSLLLVCGATLSINAATMTALDPIADCQANFNANLTACSNAFHDPQNSDYNNQTALETCNDGAHAALIACLNGNNNTLDDWEQFIEDIKACFTTWPNGGDSFETCIAGALTVYRTRLGLDPEDPCGLTPVGTARVARIDTLYTAALDLGNTDGKYPVSVQTTLTFRAGVNATQSYNLDARPCIKQARLLAIYQTKNGPRTVAMDADTDTSDGTYFDLPIFANRLVDAKDIFLVVLYFDAQGHPVFAECATLAITPSPIAGDWNRDEVLTPEDITDFLASYTAQTNRADLNDDGQVDEQDAAEFTGTSPE